MAVGDLMLGRSVGDHMQSQGPASVFAGVASTLRQADLLAGNLECVISDQGTPQFKSFTFQAPPAAIDALSSVGFDVVSLANNHSMDYGLDGLADMLARLREGGVNSVGAGADAEAAEAPVILERNGVHVAFLSYVNVPVESRTAFDTHSWAAAVEKPGVAWGEPDTIARDVAAAKTLADVVVVLLHSGLESNVAVNSIQRTLAHAAVDAGAALVIGAHSHTLQPVERYKDGIIAYSLGNFVFDGFTTPSNYSAIFTATLTPTGVESYDWVPVVIEKGLPRLATPAEAAVILPLVREQSGQ
jgi:poly-gamma-glutamate capsule biosynthesis protein CapA/YwtB (metallophosphatase superfamily)